MRIFRLSGAVMVGNKTVRRVAEHDYRHLDLPALLGSRMQRLPHVMRLLIENHLRQSDGGDLENIHEALDAWIDGRPTEFELIFRPNRLLMHDTTCTPALADIAGLKDALADAGGDPSELFPTLPVEVSVDHSLSVDTFAVRDAARRNAVAEIERNSERYAFMKWASQSMPNLRVNPPGTGIMHTINLEQLATVICLTPGDEVIDVHPDMLLGTDSHTPMINGIGVLGWGVGGLEAESVMFGQSVSLAMPEIVGVKLTGTMSPGVLSTDVALAVTHKLRALGVAGSFVEFFGPGVATLSAGDRAVIANMAPEYGATTGFFPVDARTLDYLRQTGRSEDLIALIPPIFEAMGLWFNPEAHPKFDREITFDLSALQPSLAGPRRPQDLRATHDAQSAVEAALGRPLAKVNLGTDVPDGAVGVAAITSCTNTSDPRLLVAAGLLARKAHQNGLKSAPWVKTSLAPGSPSAVRYLERAGLIEDLGAVGFDIVGFGCTTCIGNSGPLPEAITSAQGDGKAIVAVLSGNRNFPGRIHPALDLGYLASPPMVVAFALKGDIHDDIQTTELGLSTTGKSITLADIWPSEAEIDAAMSLGFRAHDVPEAFAVASGNAEWAALKAPCGAQFPWDLNSRYLRRPKFASLDEKPRLGTFSAAPLLVLGDDITTDHISPASRIDPNSEAGRWLISRGADPKDLNVFAAYRGNWEVMLRGVFTNRQVNNVLGKGLASGFTVVEGHEHPVPLHEAAEIYRERGQSTVVLAGSLYGMGSSRDWAAKAVALLGARAVIARSFERIHRTNLIGMGIAPIEITDDFIPEQSGLSCRDRIELTLPAKSLMPRQDMVIKLRRIDGGLTPVQARLAVETQQEIDTLRAGGILPRLLAQRIGSRDNDARRNGIAQ